MKNLSRLALSDEGFIFDPVNGDSYLTNPVGVFVMRKLREGLGEMEIADALRQEFEVEQDDAARDVADFTVQLRSFGLI